MNSILSIYQNNKGALDGKTLSQILAFTGDGKLKDNSKTSLDFREFLNEVPSQLITQFADNCLTDGFTDSGLALQDVINQIGSRLSFDVQHGLYRGNKNDIGFDGIWTSKDGHNIIIEVKTTDTYRINLDTIATYRTRLIEENKVDKNKSSILIVVGRDDTGDLEAQIRGSMHAWDIRLLSTDSLIKLLTLKEAFNDTKTIQQITELLKPREYTRIDKLIELIFETSKDLQIEIPTEEELEEEVTIVKKTRTSSDERTVPVNFSEECFLKVKTKLGINLIKQSRASYSNTDKATALICAVSKEYKQGKYTKFWFAFHPHQKEFLMDYQFGYVAFGCSSPKDTFLFPFNDFLPFLKNCNTTELEDRMYWHIHIHFRDNKFFIGQPGKGRGEMTDITKYKI